MTGTTTERRHGSRGMVGGRPVRHEDRVLGWALVLLGAGLAVNTLLGPLLLGLVDYPFTETVRNETIGLEAVTLVLVAPLAALAGALTLAGRPAGPVLGLAPSSYAAYMLVQYVLGPQYPSYQPSVLLHLALFVLAGGVLLRSWDAARVEVPEPRTRWAAVLLLMAAFVLSRWLPALVGSLTSEPVPAAPADLTMHWSIFLLDLGVVVPLAVTAAVGVATGAAWGGKALYGVVGWFALVPPSVAAMSTVKLLRDDPLGSLGSTVLFWVVTVLVWAVAGMLWSHLHPASGTSPAGFPSLPAAR